MTLLSILIFCFKSGNWVTKLSGAEYKIEGPKLSPVNTRLVHESFGISLVG